MEGQRDIGGVIFGSIVLTGLLVASLMKGYSGPFLLLFAVVPWVVGYNVYRLRRKKPSCPDGGVAVKFGYRDKVAEFKFKNADYAKAFIQSNRERVM
jgi:hypothetical protein